MKRVWVIALLVVSGFVLAAMAQDTQQSTVSLGDAARKARANKRSVPESRVYTNDNLPKEGSISTNSGPVTAASDQKTDTEASASTDASSGEQSDADKKADRAKLEQEWRKKIGDQKAKVAQLQRDVDDTDRQMKMQGTITSMGNGNCLNDQQKCADQMKAYEDQLAAKKNDLATAQQKLDDLREELRRAGLPGSWGD